MKDVSNTELAILAVLWEHGPQSVRQLVEAIYGEHRQSLHTSVKSLLERLATKGFVETDRSENVHRFRAIVEREEFVGDQLDKLADQVFDGQVAPILQSLVGRVKLTQKDRAAIESLLKKMK